MSPLIPLEESPEDPLFIPIKERDRTKEKPRKRELIPDESFRDLPLIDLNNPNHLVELIQIAPCESVEYDGHFVCPEWPCDEFFESKVALYRHFCKAHHADQLVQSCRISPGPKRACVRRGLEPSAGADLALLKEHKIWPRSCQVNLLQLDFIPQMERRASEGLLQEKEAQKRKAGAQMELEVEQVLLDSGRYDKCALCSETLSRALLARHYSTAHQQQFWTCELCSQTFEHKKKLLEHSDQVHQDLLTNNIQMCDKCAGFVTKGSLQQHLSACTGQLGKGVTKKPAFAALDVNAEAGSGTPRPCPHCTRLLAGQRLLESHLAVHHGEKFACTACQMEYKTLAFLRGHMQKQHGIFIQQAGPKKLVYSCQLCQVAVATVRELDQHKMEAHGVETDITYAKCPKCHDQIDQRRLRPHSSHCNGQARKRSFILGSAELMHCAHCPDLGGMKVPLLAYHMRTEHQEPLYSCKACPEKFFEARLKKQHMSETHQGKVVSLHEVNRAEAASLYEEFCIPPPTDGIY